MIRSNQYIIKSVSLNKFLLNISSFTADLFPLRGVHFKAQEKCFVRRAGQGDNVRKHKYECKVKHKNGKEAQVLMQQARKSSEDAQATGYALFEKVWAR